jgi:DNA-binding NtrC family response regulator
MEAGAGDAIRILVVDDDPGVREVVRMMLESSGYEVQVAVNGKEALACLAKEQFQVIITDLVMPEQEGIETIKVIRREYPALKVIAMSGAFGGDYLRIAGFLGAHGTLAKPLGMQNVLKVVKETLEKP